MLESFSNNIIALIFLSYTIGALLHPLLSRFKWYQKYYSLNYLTDKQSKRLFIPKMAHFIANSIFGKFNPKLRYQGKATPDKLKNLYKEMIGAEMGHLIAFIALFILCIIYIILRKSWMIILGLFVANIFLNLFLVFIQQYNKRRIGRILVIMKR